MMNGRERLDATLNHMQPDRVCVDFGSTAVTGIHVSMLTKLRRELLGDTTLVKVNEPYQMLGEVDNELRDALGVDVVGIYGRKSIFGTVQDNWKPFTMPDGTECLVPGNFNWTIDANGDYLMYPEGDTSAPPSGRMTKNGYFFDSIVRQDPIDEDKLDPADNLQEFGPLGEEDLSYYRRMKQWIDEHPQYGIIIGVPGTAFGDIALVPAPQLRHPRGIRDISEWYMSTAMRRDYVHEVFHRQCEIAEANLETMIELFGDAVQAAFITGTDFGTQTGPFIAPAAYRDLYKPFHKRINDLIHARSGWKTFIHSCGAVRQFIPDFVEAGFDILNPVQCSARDMEAERLKRDFGAQLTFWGGGVNTQHTLAFGTPDEVYREVIERVRIFNEGGGFVFNAIHNVQGNAPFENVQAMFRALQDCGVRAHAPA